MSGRLNYYLFFGGTVLLALGVGYLLVRSAWHGKWYLAMLSVWLASPIPLLAVSVFLEKRSLLSLLDPRVGSWAFLFGDVIVLPLVAALCALAWKEMDETRRAFYSMPQWYVAGISVGAIFVVLFKTLDSRQYIAAGRAGALTTPSKIVHDVGAVGVVTGSLLLCVLTPLIVEAFKHALSWQIVTAPLVALVCFVTLVAIDMWLRPAHPELAHPGGFDWETFRVVG